LREVPLCATTKQSSWIATARFAPGSPGVVIQLDGHGAERLAMTFSRFIAAITQAPALAASSRNDRIPKQL